MPDARAIRCAAKCKRRSPGSAEHDVARCVVAYEPIWAIGTGNADTPSEANAIMGEIRAAVPGLASCRMLYGGSMKPDNVAEFVRAAEHRRRPGRRREPRARHVRRAARRRAARSGRVSKRKPFVLAILDGWGTTTETRGNAIARRRPAELDAHPRDAIRTRCSRRAAKPSACRRA